MAEVGLHRLAGHDGQGASMYEAVRGVDLDVPTGSITALLGTNGAGKTSTLEVIEGLTVTWSQAAQPLLVIAAWTYLAVMLARRSMQWEPRA